MAAGANQIKKHLEKKMKGGTVTQTTENKTKVVTIQTLGYRWCYYKGRPTIDETPYVMTTDIHGHYMVYCRHEKYEEHNNDGSSPRCGIRMVKILKEEMKTVE